MSVAFTKTAFISVIVRKKTPLIYFMLISPADVKQPPQPVV